MVRLKELSSFIGLDGSREAGSELILIPKDAKCNIDDGKK